MASLLNGVAQHLPTPNHKIKDLIHYSANHLIEENVKNSIGRAIYLVGMKLDAEEKVLESLPRVNIIYTDRDEITYTLETGDLGNHVSLVIYQTTKMQRYNELQQLVIAVEELAHHFWNISDELEVKHKVTEIINLEFPSIVITDLYNLDSI
jgi:hypothetical protein